MSVCGRLGRLERRHPPRRPRVRFVVLDHPPDGRTRVFMDDGTELPQGADWRQLAGEGTYTVMGGIDIDVVVGRKNLDDGSGTGGRRRHGGQPA